MKKAYRKPTAELVDFSLASSVANTCGTGDGENVNNGWGNLAFTSETCEIDMNFLTCYHVPMADGSVFGS